MNELRLATLAAAARRDALSGVGVEVPVHGCCCTLRLLQHNFTVVHLAVQARGFRGLRFGYASRKCSVALKAYTTGMGMTDAVNKDAVNTNMRMNRCRT